MNRTKKAKPDTLRAVHIEIDGKDVVAWEPKDPTRRGLGRWTDPEALLKRIYELEHPETVEMVEGPGRQWQQSWRGRFAPGARQQKPKKAA